MIEENILRSNNVVLLFKNGSERTKIAKNLKEGNYKTFFSSSFQEALVLIGKHNASIFIQDWDAIDRTQTRSFHHKISQNAAYDSVIRILVAGQLTSPIKSFVNDTGIHESLTMNTAVQNMTQKIDMLLNSATLHHNRIFREAGHYEGEYHQHKVDEAVEKAHRDFPHDSRIILEYGNLLYRRENFEEAAAIAKNLLEESSDNVRAMTLLSRALMRLGDFEKGLEAMKAADSMSPFNPGRLATIGDAYYENQDIDAALEYYDKAVSLDSQCKEAQLGKTKAYLAKGHLSQALDVVQASLSEEEAAGLFNGFAMRACREKKFDEAIKLYQVAFKALKTKKLKHMLHFNMSITYEAMGDMISAMGSLKTSIRLKSDYQKAIDRLNRLEIKAKRVMAS